MEELYTCKFRILHTIELPEKQMKECTVLTKIKHETTSEMMYEGELRVQFNEFGIFPVAKDIANAISQRSLRQKVAAELKRYVRPHKNFL
ncbi:diaminopimelate epimerase [Bacillus sp. CGMCC 1.16541]|uniref:diaminopimelate epimerase n=1 Tax=Bacillus sp. CGMCC 1.16541 TaxID=2185143 RepID=UPI000D728C24|nr:diaminopimelate epimerase [Bacillus sp. CGMCC 1.16541]